MKKVIGVIAANKNGEMVINGFSPTGEFGYRLKDEYLDGGDIDSITISAADMTDEGPGLIPKNSQDARYANSASPIVTIYENESGSHDIVIGGFSIHGRSIQIDSQMDDNSKLKKIKISKAPVGCGFSFNGGASNR